MGDTIALPWAQQQEDAPDFTKSAVEGVQAAQALGAAHALRGVDFNDPSSVDNALTGLTQNGAIDQANAVQNLNFTRGMKARIGQIMDTVTGAMAGGQPQTQQPPSADPAAAPAAAPTPGNFQFDPKRASAIMQDGVHAIDMLKTTDDPQTRITHWLGDGAGDPGIRGYFAKLGVPAESLDAITPHLADDATLDGLKSHYQDMVKHWGGMSAAPGGAPGAPPGQSSGASGLDALGQPVVTAQRPLVVPPQALPAAAPPPPPQMHPITQGYVPNAGWARNLVSNGPAMFAIGMSKNTGMDLGPLGEAAEKLAGPEIAKEADEAHAAGITRETDRGKMAYAEQLASAAARGSGVVGKVDYPLGDGSGKTVQITPDMAADLANVSPAIRAAALHSLSQGGGTSQSTFQKSAAEAAGAATQRLEDVPVTDPETGETRTVKMPAASYTSGYGKGQLPAGVGYTPSDMQKTSNAADASTMADTRKAIGPESLNAHQAVIDNATAGQALLKSGAVTPNDFTGQAQKVAGVLNALGIQSKDANNLSLYQRVASTSLLAHSHDFAGRNTDKDLAIEKGAAQQMTTPKDAASFALAMQAATANRSKQWETFVTEHPEFNSHKAAVQAFNNGPNRGSIYADPAFRDVTFNGKPAVTNVTTMPSGEQWGLFLHQPFRIR